MSIIHTDQACPVILLAYAADWPEDEDQPRNLPEEQRLLYNLLKPLEQKGLIKIALCSNVTAPKSMQSLTSYAGRVAILHFSGHAGRFADLLSTGEEEEAAYQPLAAIFQRQTGIKLVFVSGCLNESLADDLLACGVPLVIGTLDRCEDKRAIAFAVAFYSALCQGAGLETAFQQAATAQHGDTLLAPAGTDAWPWLLRARNGAEDARAWNIPEAAGDYLLGLPKLESGSLPEKPYHQALAWYGRQEAEIFFGRNRQIRALYRRLTGPDSAPLQLLCGQSGVGKSSLLEAGLIPRLEAANHQVHYLRRDRDGGAAATLRQALALPADCSDELLAPAWCAIEQAAGHSLIVIFDQVEEIFTRGQAADEMEALAAACDAVFGAPIHRPNGRLLLSFRKEYQAEIEDALRRRNLEFSQMLLKRLDRAGICEVVNGPSGERNHDLRNRYQLRVEPGLAEKIADDLSSDPDSPIATILQILLIEMWEKAHKIAPAAPYFDTDLYTEVCKTGILLDDFLRQRLAEFERKQQQVVASGLLLDLLHFHTTPRGTAEQRSGDEIIQEYDQTHDLPAIIGIAKHLRLLADPTGDEHATLTTTNHLRGARLAHDTLAPVIRAAYAASSLPGQRARRILEGRITDWKSAPHSILKPLDADDLRKVEMGRSGMRLLNADEQALLATSRQARARQERRERFQLWIGLGALAAILLLAVLTTWFGFSMRQSAAEAERQRQAAQASAVQAQAQKAIAVNAQATAMANAAIAEQERISAQTAQAQAETNLQQAQMQQALAEAAAHRSKASELANYAGAELAKPAPDPSLALLLAQAAVRATWETDGYIMANADAALQQAVDTVRTIGWLRTFPAHRHTEPVHTVVFYPDGGTLLSGSADQSLRVWNVANGQQTAMLAAHAGPVLSAAVAPDGAWAVSGGADGRILQWNMATGTISATLAATGSAVHSLAVRPDGRWIAAGLNSGAVQLIDLQTPAHTVELPGHLLRVNAVAFAPVADQMASAGADGLIRLWDLNTGELLAILPGHAGGTRWVGYTGGWLFSAGDNGSIKQWDVQSQNEMASIQLNTGDLRSAALSAGGHFMASVHGDGTVYVWPVADPGSRVRLSGHANAALSVAFSPDGSLLTTGGEDHSVRVWNLADKEELPYWGGHTGEVRTAEFSPDGQMVLTTGEDGSVRLWNLADGTVVEHLRWAAGVGVMNRYASFSPDGRQVVIGSDDGSVRIWQPGGGVRLCIAPTGKAVYSAVFSPDGATVLVAGVDATAQLLDAADCSKVIRRFSGHSATVRTAFFDATGERIVTASADGAARIWRVATGEELTPPLAHDGWMLSAVFSPDGRQVATGGRDRVARIWNAQNGEMLAELPAHAGEVRGAVYSPDGKLLATIDQDGSTWFWDTADWSLVRRLFGHSGSVRSAAFSPQGDYFVTAGWDGSVRAWLVQPPTRLHSFENNQDVMRTLSYSPNGSTIATGGDYGTVILWDAASGQQLARFDAEANGIWALAFSPDGTTLLAGCNDGYVRIWPLKGDGATRKYKVAADAVRTIVFDRSGQLLATAGADHIVRIWDAASFTNIRLYPASAATVLAASFSPDGQTLATAGEDGIISIWNTQTDDKLAVIADPSDSVLALAYSPNGRLLAAAGEDGWVRLYDAGSGALQLQFQSEQGSAGVLAFTPDGGWLFSAGEDGPIRVWDLASDAPVRQLSGHDGGVWALTISPSGQALASVGSDRQIRLWETDVTATLDAAAAMIQREPPLLLPDEQKYYELSPAGRPIAPTTTAVTASFLPVARAQSGGRP